MGRERGTGVEMDQLHEALVVRAGREIDEVVTRLGALVCHLDDDDLRASALHALAHASAAAAATRLATGVTDRRNTIDVEPALDLSDHLRRSTATPIG